MEPFDSSLILIVQWPWNSCCALMLGATERDEFGVKIAFNSQGQRVEWIDPETMSFKDAEPVAKRSLPAISPAYNEIKVHGELEPLVQRQGIYEQYCCASHCSGCLHLVCGPGTPGESNSEEGLCAEIEDGGET
jgi:hypothetical protein